MSEIFPESPLTSLSAAVAAMGALPMPVGSQALSAERELEIRSLDLLTLMSDRAAPVISGHLAALLDEVTRLRAERAAIGDEVARFGIFGAALPATRALVKRADELVTENAGLRARVAALLDERRSTNEALDDVVQELRARQSCLCPPADQPGPHQLGCPQAEVPVAGASVEESADRLTAFFAPVAALREVSSREEPHDSPLHHDYKGPSRDLPMPPTCRLSADELDEVSRRFIGGES